MKRSSKVLALAAALVTGTLLMAPSAIAAPGQAGSSGGGHNETGGADTVLRGYAQDTWTSLAAMTDKKTGLPADKLSGDLTVASENTSPTNIGGYLWSTISARDLGIISKNEAYQRMKTTLKTLSVIERHAPSGMYYNWYSRLDGHKLTTWPDSGDPVDPFLSTVDNGWLAAAFRVVAAAEPRLASSADALYDSMDFGYFHDLAARPEAGLNRGGFWVVPPAGCNIPGNYGDDGPDVYYTCHWYDTTVSEARIATYLGISNGQIPPEAYYGTVRTMPDEGCDYSWQEQKPTGVTREYLGVSVYEGVYSYRGMSLVPAWGGSMFEALMPDLFVPEAQWGPRSWGVNHPASVRAQVEHGLDETRYGYWGFSPASDPFGEYAEYGVEGIGMSSDGYASDRQRTDVDGGYDGCREATNPTPTFGDGVVTPHASFLALAYDQTAALKNLANLKTDFDSYGPGGFYDAVATQSGTVADRYLSLDQSMTMAAITNELLHDRVKGYFVDRHFAATVKPLVAAQIFGSRLG
ncbi:glucoamylase family protein [Cryobacterium sp. PH29-G1]|uniref:glucoamylase family protein n=1 Tax=Cryobacterium sp. PH29-G1 TaxID=3046211 RepID=UPI0032D8E951